jgi:hypothetical protein
MIYHLSHAPVLLGHDPTVSASQAVDIRGIRHNGWPFICFFFCGTSILISVEAGLIYIHVSSEKELLPITSFLHPHQYLWLFVFFMIATTIYVGGISVQFWWPKDRIFFRVLIGNFPFGIYFFVCSLYINGYWSHQMNI